MEELRTISGLSKVISIIAKICFIALIVVVCFDIVAFAWTILATEGVDAIDMGSISVKTPINWGNYEMEFADKNSQIIYLAVQLMKHFIVMLLLLVVSIFFKGMNREQTPFTEKAPKYCVYIGVLMLLLEAAPQFTGLAFNVALLGKVAITSETTGLMGIICVLISICFAAIFKYGRQLTMKN